MARLEGQQKQHGECIQAIVVIHGICRNPQLKINKHDCGDSIKYLRIISEISDQNILTLVDYTIRYSMNFIQKICHLAHKCDQGA